MVALFASSVLSGFPLLLHQLADPLLSLTGSPLPHLAAPSSHRLPIFLVGCCCQRSSACQCRSRRARLSLCFASLLRRAITSKPETPPNSPMRAQLRSHQIHLLLTRSPASPFAPTLDRARLASTRTTPRFTATSYPLDPRLRCALPSTPATSPTSTVAALAGPLCYRPRLAAYRAPSVRCTDVRL